MLDQRDDLSLIQLKQHIKDLDFKIQFMTEEAARDKEQIAKLKYEKTMTPQVDSMIQTKMLQKEYQIKYEKARDENITLKAIQLKQSNALISQRKMSKETELDSLIQELRHSKEKNYELQFTIKKMDKVTTDLVNANAILKQKLRNLKNKNLKMVTGNSGTDDIMINYTG